MLPIALATLALCPLQLGAPAPAPAPEPAPPPPRTRLAWADCDGDGLDDVLVLRAAGPLRLLRNDGAGGFADVTTRAGLEGLDGARGALWEDVDGDGRPDLLLVVPEGAGRLLRNVAGAGFEDVGALAGLPLDAGVRAARFLDYDADGRADLVLTTARGERLFHGLGRFAFEEVALDPDAIGAAPPAGGGEPAAAPPAAPAPPSAPPSGSATQVPPGALVQGAPTCPPTIEDWSDPGSCLAASSVPALGMLWPLSAALNVEAGTGFVGMGTTNPSARLDVAGDVEVDGVLISNLTSSAPLKVSSSQKVNGLNVDRLDGLDSTDFTQLGQTIGNSELEANCITTAKIYNGSVVEAKLGNGAVSSAKIQADAVGTAQIATGAVRNKELDDGAVTTEKIFDGTIRPQDLQSPLTSSGTEPTLEVENTGYGPAFRAVGPGGTCEIGGAALIGYAVMGEVGLMHDAGLYGVAPYGTAGKAVLGEANDGDGRGVVGKNLGTSGLGDGVGVEGITYNPGGSAVKGRALVSGGTGVRGYTTSASGWGVFADGDLGCSGIKAFVQPHPSDPTRQIRFVSLEGNESGTYFRGSAQLAGGVAVIEVPEEFRLASEEEGLTVQLTARAADAGLWVADVGLESIVVRGRRDAAFDYFVNGVRRGWAGVETIQENRAFVPRERGVPFGTQYPEAFRRILVENGTLLPDFTPDEALAARLGRALRDPDERAGAAAVPVD